MNSEKNTPRLIAAALTILLCLLALAGLWYGIMTTSPTVKPAGEWPPIEPDEAEMLEIDPEQDVIYQYIAASADDVLEFNNTDRAAPSEETFDENTQFATDPNDNAATEGIDSNLLTSNEENPEYQKQDVEQPGNKAPQPDAKAQAEAARRQKANEEASNRIDRLNNSGRGEGEGRRGEDFTDGIRPDGGKGGDGSHKGSYTMRYDMIPKSSKSGTIAVTCKVNPDGSVVPGSAKATPNGSSGKVYDDKKLVKACEEMAASNKFARLKGETTILYATIYFKWK